MGAVLLYVVTVMFLLVDLHFLNALSLNAKYKLCFTEVFQRSPEVVSKENSRVLKS